MVAGTASVRRERIRFSEGLPAFLLGFALVPVLAANGGYLPTEWGWTAMALAGAAAAAASFRAPAAPSRPALLFIGGFTLFACWLAVSNFWTEAPAQTPLEVERSLVYVAATLALMTVVRPRRASHLAGGICAALTAICAFALATRLFPDHFAAPDRLAGARLSTPVGYWNALGLVAAMGALLALPIAARAASRWQRALAAAALPVLVLTLYFTFSRGAWLSLALGFVTLVAADRRRLQLLAVAAPLVTVTALVVLRASRTTELTHTGVPVGTAAHAGHRLAVVVLVSCLAIAYLAIAFRWLERSVKVSRRVRTASGWLVVGLAVVALGAVFARAGSPFTIAHRAYHSIESSPPAANGNLNNRLFSLSSNGRLDQWRIAVRMIDRQPLRGLGAGSFEQEWFRQRPYDSVVRDTHSLYLETLGEDGIIGLVILAGALLAPILAFPRARREPLAAGALAAYVAFLAHAGVDWDWELAGVTLSALLCGGVLLAAGRSGSRAERWRSVPIVLGSVVILASFVGLAGNLALGASASSAASGKWSRAASQARRAKFWAPWSATAWQRLGEAQLGEGDKAAGRASLAKAVSMSPDDWELWLELGNASSGSARTTALERAHRLDPLDSIPVPK